MTSQQESDEEYLDDPIQLIDFKQMSFAGETKTATDYELADADGDLFIEKYNNVVKNNLPRYDHVAITLPVSFFEIPENLNHINECRPLSIKIVDCDKYPWYYKKYLTHDDVAKDAIKSNIVKESNAKKINLTTIDGMKPKIRPVDTPYEVLVASPKAHQMPGMKVESSLKDLQTLLKEQSSKLKNVMQVDFKKNQGLIGMKISLTQETYTALRKKHKEKDKKVKTKTKDKKHGEETSSVVANKILLGSVETVPTNNVKTSEKLKTIAKSATNKVTKDILVSHVNTDQRIDTCAHAKSSPTFANKLLQDSQKNNVCEKKNTPQNNKQLQNNNNNDMNIVLVKQKQKNFHSNLNKVLSDDWEIRNCHSKNRNNRKANEQSKTNVDFQDIQKTVNREEKVNKIKQSAKKSSEVENKRNNQTSSKQKQGNIKNNLCKPQKSVTKKGDEVDKLIKNLEFSSKDKTQGNVDDGKAKSIEKQKIKKTKNINKISNKKPKAINSVNAEKVIILSDQFVNSGHANDVTSCKFKPVENANAFVQSNTSAVTMQSSNIPNTASASQNQLRAFPVENAVNVATQPQISKLNISHSETVSPVQICGPGNVDNYARDSIHKVQVKLNANANVTIPSVSNSQTIHQNILPSCNVSQMPSNGYTGKPITDYDFTYSPEGQLQVVVNANKNLNTIPINSYVVPRSTSAVTMQSSNIPNASTAYNPASASQKQLSAFQVENAVNVATQPQISKLNISHSETVPPVDPRKLKFPLPGCSKLLAIRRKKPDLGIAGIHDKLLEHFPDYASHVEQNNNIALQRLVQDLQNISKPENTNSGDGVKNGSTLDSVKIINSEANVAPLASISHNTPQKYQMKNYPDQHLQNVSKPSELHLIHAHVHKVPHSKMQTTAAGNKVDFSSHLQNPTPYSKSTEERPRKIQILISNRLSIAQSRATANNLWLNDPRHQAVQQQLPPTCDIAPPQLIPSLRVPQNTQLSQFSNTTTLEPRQLPPKLNMPSQNNLINSLPVKTTKRQMLSNTNPIILKKTRLCKSNNKIDQHYLPQHINALTQNISDPNYEQLRQMCGSGIPSSPYMHCAPISSDNPFNMNPANPMPYEMQNYLHNYYPYTPQMLPPPPPPPPMPPPYFGPHHASNRPPQNVKKSVETNQTTQSPKSIAGSTIIGCNNTGPVRKINILATPTDISDKNSHNPTKIQLDNEKPVASKKEMMEELSKIDSPTRIGLMTGYSPPILPIPSYIKTLEILAKSGILETTKKQIEIDQSKNRESENNCTSKSPKIKLQEDIQDKGAKKISLDEYKKRVTKTDNKKDETMRANIKIEIKCENTEQDLGYDSDSTMRI